MRVWSGLLSVVLLVAFAPVPLRASTSQTIRVGLLREQDRVVIVSDRGIDVQNSGGRNTLAPGAYDFVNSGQGIELWNGQRFEGILRLVPTGGARLYVGNRPYRGVIELRPTATRRLTVINELDLEEYLYGVIKMEMDPRWPKETLKAQAVAARTMALHSLNRFQAEGYDVRATTDSQVYGGVLAEDSQASAAVDETRGIIMTYLGRPILAVYHSDSGGHTESSEYVWGGTYAYLRGVPDPYAGDATGHTWVSRVELSTLEERLRRAGKSVNGVTGIETVAMSPSGRVLSVQLLTSGGRVEVKATELRTALGAEVLRSTLFTVRVLPGEVPVVEFAGRGSGHGVGLSQWGARGQGLQGRSYIEILRYYYADVRVESR